jgi:hypothetical protein
MTEPRTGEIREGFVRQRRSLVAVSLVLLVFLEVGARLDRLEFLGNTIVLSKPLVVSLPLWVAWAYFLLRYYQYFRDTGDAGFGNAVVSRQHSLARRAAIAKLEQSLRPEPPEDRPAATWSIEVEELEILDEPPSFWRFKAKGWIHFRDKGSPAWAAAQILSDHEVVLPPGVPPFPQVRAAIWSAVHTRYFTEYGLPYIVAGLPLLASLLHRLGWHLAL